MKNKETGTIHRMRLDAEPFEKIKTGKKTIELRLNDEKRKTIKVGDLVRFAQRGGEEAMFGRVIGRSDFRDFEELYANLPLEKCGYGSADAATAKDMEKYYSLEKQRQYGVVGIEFEKIVM